MTTIILHPRLLPSSFVAVKRSILTPLLQQPAHFHYLSRCIENFYYLLVESNHPDVDADHIPGLRVEVCRVTLVKRVIKMDVAEICARSNTNTSLYGDLKRFSGMDTTKPSWKSFAHRAIHHGLCAIDPRFAR